MEILIGIAIVLGGLHLWRGHSRRARIVATILLVPFCALGVGTLTGHLTTPINDLNALGGGIIGSIAGWYLAAWPRLYRQHKIKEARSGGSAA